MNTRSGNGTKRTARILAIAGAALVAALVATEVPVEAGGGQGGRHHGHRAAHMHRHHGAHGAFYVPTRIYGPDLVTYRPWYGGSVYYGPHGHYHMSYSFPVLVGGSIVYRPYAYCGDQLFAPAPISIPRLMVGFNLGPHVSVYGEVPLASGEYVYAGPGY